MKKINLIRIKMINENYVKEITEVFRNIHLIKEKNPMKLEKCNFDSIKKYLIEFLNTKFGIERSEILRIDSLGYHFLILNEKLGIGNKIKRDGKNFFFNIEKNEVNIL